MAPSKSDHDWDALDDNVDTIDLTLSSPEPEPRPYTQPRQQQPNIDYFKREPRPRSMTRIKDERTQSGGAARNSPRPQQPRQINPQHIVQIVNSSDTNALRKVLLDLCNISPALSGAVARGLAPYSTFAQATINRQRVKPQIPNINPRIRPDPELRRPSASSSRPLFAASAIERPPVPRIKHERKASPTDDSDASSNIVNISRSYPRSPQPYTLVRTPKREVSSGPAHLDNSQRLASIQAEPEAVPTTCIRCHHHLDGDSERCRWHPRSISFENGHPSYECCHRPVNAAGCMSGPHIGGTDQVQRSPLKRSQPIIPVSTSGSQVSKKPRNI